MISIPQPIARILFYRRNLDKQGPSPPPTKDNGNKRLPPNRLGGFWPSIHFENITNVDADCWKSGLLPRRLRRDW